MIENSSHGLTVLDPDREVVVTREEHHQRALAAWAPRPDGRARRVAVELRFAPVSHGTHAGQRGIEVRLDGQRVGELTKRMSDRYAPLVEDVLRRGGRPGCVALVVHGSRGVEVELRLPEVVAGVGPVVPPPAAPRPGTPDTAPAGRSRRGRTPILIGAGVVTLLLVIGVVGTAIGSRDAPVAALPDPSAVIVAATGTPTPTVSAPPMGSPAPTPPGPPAVVVAASAPTPKAATPKAPTPKAPPTPNTPPIPKPVAQPPKPVPTKAPAPAPAPARPPVAEPVEPPVARPPARDCDPNYGGCVPVASDVDCEGGSGNGPAYVRGPVDVIGSDIYGLDADNDGTGCDS